MTAWADTRYEEKKENMDEESMRNVKEGSMSEHSSVPDEFPSENTMRASNNTNAILASYKRKSETGTPLTSQKESSFSENYDGNSSKRSTYDGNGSKTSVVTLDQLATRRSKHAEKHLEEREPNHLFWFVFKCAGSITVIIVTLFVVSFILIYGLNRDDFSGNEDEVPENNVPNNVISGLLLALARTGRFAAIQNHLGYFHVYQKNSKNSTGDQDLPLWSPLGSSSLTSKGSVNIAPNGTMVVFVDGTTHRPQVMEYDHKRDIWTRVSGPFLLADDVVTDDEISLMMVAIRGRVIASAKPTDTLLTFELSGSDWIETKSTNVSSRIYLEGLQSFELSPAGSFLVVTTNQDTTTMVQTFRWLTTDSGSMWEPIDPEFLLPSGNVSLSLGQDTFAVTSPEIIQVFSYGGRTWGKPLEAEEGYSFASAALSVDGRTLAVGSIRQEDQKGQIEWYTFPFNQDTGEDWKRVEEPSIIEEDDFAKMSPWFGIQMEIDGEVETLAAQSGDQEGNQYVHFYSTNMTVQAQRVRI